MDYTIVTAWYDVREKENHPEKDDKTNKFFCSMEWYFDSAKDLFNKPFPMVIFTEPRFEQLILAARPQSLHSMTKIIYKDFDDLLYYDLFPKYEENYKKNPIHNLTKEKFTPLYQFIVNQKVNFVKEAIELNPFQSTQFAWMDMRLHCVYDMQIEETNQVMSELPPNQVRLMQMSFTEPVCNRRDFYRWTRGKVAAGFFAGYTEPLLRFCTLCQQELVTAIEEETAPTDEMIYSFIASHHPDIFDLYVGEYSDCLRNQLRIRKSTHLVFPFLQTVYHRKMHSYTIALSERIRRGIQSRELHLNPDEIHKAYTFGFLALLDSQQKERAEMVIKEYMDMAATREDVAAWIRDRRAPVNEHLEGNLLEDWMAI